MLACEEGVIFNILTLQAEVAATDAYYELIKHLKPMIDLRRNVNKNLSGPDFDLDQMNEALARAKGSSKGKSWFPTLFEQLSTQVNAEMLKVGRLDLTLDLNINALALSLEVKISTLFNIPAN